MNKVTDYGDRLKEALDAAKVSRKSLAGKLGTSAQAVGMVINGQSGAFNAENHSIAASYLGYEALWLATGKGEKKVSSRNKDIGLSAQEIRFLEAYRQQKNESIRAAAFAALNTEANDQSDGGSNTPARKVRKAA